MPQREVSSDDIAINPAEIAFHLFGSRWELLRGARLFLTGGTGFIGRWLLECLALAEDRLSLGLSVLVLTRESRGFAQAHHDVDRLLTHQAIRFLEGDVRSFDYPNEMITHIIHGAHTSAKATFHREDPLIQFDTACLGARRVLELALQSGARRFLMLSSGSVYGAQPADMPHLREDYIGAPLPQDIDAALSHGKRAAEFLVSYYRQKHGLEAIIARCFSLIGPGLPLNIHYAAGNFIRDALYCDEILIQGDGSAIRSYLDISDLLVWLLVMLTIAPSGGIYNAGSDVPISILELATRVRNLLAPGKPIRVIGENRGQGSRNRYVPDIMHARESLQLDAWTPLDNAICRTGKYARTWNDRQITT